MTFGEAIDALNDENVVVKRSTWEDNTGIKKMLINDVYKIREVRLNSDRSLTTENGVYIPSGNDYFSDDWGKITLTTQE